MFEQLDRYDWNAHAAHEPRAHRMPRLLRRFFTGDRVTSRKACRVIWFVLAGDDGYKTAPGLAALTAVAVAEALPELDPAGRRRAALLLNDTLHEMWMNI